MSELQLGTNYLLDNHIVPVPLFYLEGQITLQIDWHVQTNKIYSDLKHFYNSLIMQTFDFITKLIYFENSTV